MYANDVDISILEVLQDNEYLHSCVKELDAYARTIAHEIRTPLAAIQGFACLLRDYHGDFDEEERLQAAQAIIDQSKRLCEMVDSLLRLSEVQGSERILLEPLDMGEIVQRTSDNLHSIILESGACIVMPERWPLALGHAPWVEHIWANYLSNAIKYGGTPPLVHLGAELSAEGHITFWIRDNGKGLSHYQQATLFQPFVRHVDHSIEGHGLGLAIVARIVSRLGGQVGVESSVNEGSTFTFSLPAAEAVAARRRTL